jgi:hypothetical protein
VEQFLTPGAGAFFQAGHYIFLHGGPSVYRRVRATQLMALTGD